MPAQSTPFVGRAEDLANLQQLLADPACRLLTLVGAGGIGKTRLALETAATAEALFTDGAVFAPLQSLVAATHLVPFLASAMKVTFYNTDAPHDQLLAYLRNKSLLLVLDNFEHLLPDTSLINDILIQAPAVKILVTSREVLNLQEEWLYPLKGMRFPPSVYSAQLDSYEAIRLFAGMARRVRTDFSLEDNQEAIVHICRITDGMPLALEMAAGWLKVMSCREIAAEIQTNFNFLATSARNTPPRHQNMRAVFDSSWRLLSPDEQRAFAKLAIFQGGFERAAAEEVAEATTGVLANLIDKSFVAHESDTRYRIHELLRQYGRDKLSQLDEMEAVQQRHARYYAGVMRRCEAQLKQPDSMAAIRAIEADFENIRQAWEWSVEHDQADFVHAMLDALYLFGFLRSRYSETIGLFQWAVARAPRDLRLVGRLLSRRWGYLHWWYQVDYAEALEAVQRAQAIALRLDDHFEVAFANLMLGYVNISQERYGDALPILEQSRAQFEALGEDYYVCWVLHRIGYVYINLSDIDRSVALTEQSLVLARATYNRVAQVICLYNLGSILILNRNYLKATVYCEEALQVAADTGHQGQIAHSLSLLALCAFCRGEFDRCADYAQRSLKVVREINLLVFQPYPLSLLIMLACLREDYAEAVRLDELGQPHRTNKMGYALLYWSLAALECGLNDLNEARGVFQNALQIAHALGGSVFLIWLLPCAACILAETQPGKAVELLAWVDGFPDSALEWVHQWGLLHRLRARLRDQLGEHAYQRHSRNGAALDFAAVQAALRAEFGAAAADRRMTALPDPLTPREIDVLRCLAAGLTNPQIAAQLVIGAGTVKTHTLNIYRKLDVTNRTQAIVRATELRLLPD